MHAGSDLAHELRQHYLFAALSEAESERLLASSQTRRFAAGEHLFSHGQAASHFFLLRSGSVKLYRLSPEGDEKIMRLIRPDESFAESILFIDPPRYLVHGEGVEAGELVALDRDTFLAILKESFPTCRAVMAQMSLRIQAHWDEIETLALRNSRYRVAHYLLGLAPANASGRLTVTLPARKVLIAAHLALTPETLSRTLRTLTDEELIEVAGDAVTILDVEGLRRHMH